MLQMVASISYDDNLQGAQTKLRLCCGTAEQVLPAAINATSAVQQTKLRHTPRKTRHSEASSSTTPSCFVKFHKRAIICLQLDPCTYSASTNLQRHGLTLW